MVFGQYNKKERRKKSLHVTRVKVRVVERLDRMSISNLLTSDFINELGPKTWNSCETVIISALNHFLIKSTASGKFRWLPMRNRMRCSVNPETLPLRWVRLTFSRGYFRLNKQMKRLYSNLLCTSYAIESLFFTTLENRTNVSSHSNFFRTTQKETIWWNGETFFASFKSLNTQLESYLPQCRSATPTNGRVYLFALNLFVFHLLLLLLLWQAMWKVAEKRNILMIYINQMAFRDFKGNGNCLCAAHYEM